MKKKILDFILIICIISILQTVLPITVWGVTFTDSIGGVGSPSTPIKPLPPTFSGIITSGIYTYTVSNEEATITGCKSASGALTIPSTIDGYPVTKIGQFAFRYCTSLTSVKIPDGVIQIQSLAFFGCTSLTSVTIPDSVISISNAFQDCTRLTSITIPDNVIYISDGAFNRCTSLTYITVSKSNNNYCSDNGVLFNKDKTTLICYPAGRTDISYNIPNSVKSIGAWAFSDCNNLTSITIPNNVTEIDNDAFSGCINLTGVTIPNSVTEIGNYAFSYCTSLTNITIPDSVTEIGHAVFNGSTCLTDITVSKNNNYYCSDDGVLFNKSKTILIHYPAGKSATAYIIPDSVINIGNYAFYNCTSLASVTLGKGVTEIEYFAFYKCTRLASVELPNSIAKISNSAFFDCTSLTDVYYKGTESEWESIYSDSYNDALTNATRHYIKHTRTTISEEGKTFYVNPINIEIGVSVILALYDKGEFVEAQSATYEGKEITFTTTKSYTNANVMVWDNFTTLNPICEIEVVK